LEAQWFGDNDRLPSHNSFHDISHPQIYSVSFLLARKVVWAGGGGLVEWGGNILSVPGEPPRHGCALASAPGSWERLVGLFAFCGASSRLVPASGSFSSPAVQFASRSFAPDASAVPLGSVTRISELRQTEFWISGRGRSVDQRTGRQFFGQEHLSFECRAIFKLAIIDRPAVSEIFSCVDRTGRNRTVAN